MGARGTAQKDQTTGWFTVRSRDGGINAKIDDRYYVCIAPIGITDCQDVQNRACKSLRKIERDEVCLALECPGQDEASGNPSTMERMRCTALKDELTGWITVKGS